jgi:hypothetical protein
MEKMMRHYAVLGVIGLAASGAWAQQATPPAQPPTSAVFKSGGGDGKPTGRRLLELRGSGRNQRQNRRDPFQRRHGGVGKDISLRFSVTGTSNEGLNIYDRSWNVLKSGAWKYTPNDGAGFPTPLTIGKAWSFQGNDVNAGNGFTWSRSGPIKSRQTGNRDHESRHVRDVQD